MTKILIIFMIIVLGIALLLFMTAGATGFRRATDDPSLYEDGDHIYYDRSAIEKKEFARRNPHVKDVRSFTRLFHIIHGRRTSDKS